MKMLQVTIRTGKFEEELAFYKEIVGLKVVRDLREKGRGIVFLADSKGDTCIEIIDVPGADDAGNRLLSIGFDSGDADKMREKLIALGMEVGAHHNRSCGHFEGSFCHRRAGNGVRQLPGRAG